MLLHKYNKQTIKEVNDPSAVMRELENVISDLRCYYSHPEYLPPREELESYKTYLGFKLDYLLFGEDHLVIHDGVHGNLPEAYEYLREEHGITDPKVVTRDEWLEQNKAARRKKRGRFWTDLDTDF